jgi:hypothetical protein
MSKILLFFKIKTWHLLPATATLLIKEGVPPSMIFLPLCRFAVIPFFGCYAITSAIREKSLKVNPAIAKIVLE